jgi:FAD/FMN-containing dehydrogenase
MAMRARSGRHSLEGWSSLDGGLVIDVSRMKGVSIDPTARTATVGTGLTQKETVAALGQRGFIFPTGSEGSVGLGGVILGGGLGLPTRSYGMVCDNLLAAEIVVADGSRSAKVVEASERSNADLLWASRGGGGGNFGIATSYTLKVHEPPDVEFLIAKWTGHRDLGAVFRTWPSSGARWAPTSMAPTSTCPRRRRRLGTRVPRFQLRATAPGQDRV